MRNDLNFLDVVRRERGGDHEAEGYTGTVKRGLPEAHPGGFAFATGIECSYPTIADGDGRTLRRDQLAECGHYERWRDDLRLVRELGLNVLRYYSSSKAGQVAFAKMAALELAKHKIRVNVICPGAIESNIEASAEKRAVEEAREPAEYPAGKIPLTDGKPGTAEQVARLVLFLASDAASHVTGTEVWIDGAESLLQG